MYIFRKLITSLILIVSLSFLFLLNSCGEEGENATQKSQEEILQDSIASIQSAEDARLDDLRGQLVNAPIYYCKTDLVIVRQEPNLASVEVDQVKMGEELRFAGELGGDSTGVMTNDEISIDQFALVLTPREKIGWVHKSILQKESPQAVDVASVFPLELSAISGRDLGKDAWQAIFMDAGECEGGGCPKFFTNTAQTFMLLEVCDPLDKYQPGIHLFLSNGEVKYYSWWEDFYGTESCHQEGQADYTLEKMSETEAGPGVIELRLKYEFEERYGEYLLELGEDPEPFVLEEKTGTNDM